MPGEFIILNEGNSVTNCNCTFSQVPVDPRYRDIPSENVPGHLGQEAVSENVGCKVEIDKLFLISILINFRLQDDLGQVS